VEFSHLFENPYARTGVIFASVYGFFKWLDSITPVERKLQLAVWLTTPPSQIAATRWADTLAHIYENVFGKAFLSWFFVRRSVLASMAMVSASLVLWAVVDPGVVFFELRHISWTWPEVLVLGFVTLNIIPDAVSLIKAHAIIRLMQSARTPHRFGALLILDTFLSFGLATLAVVGIFFVPESYPRDTIAARIMDIFRQGLFRRHVLCFASDEIGFTPSVFFYASVSTAAWVWLQASAALIIRASRLGDYLARNAGRFVRIDEKPLVVVGSMAACLAVGIYWVAYWIGRAGGVCR
jgi:hypothetical protein